MPSSLPNAESNNELLKEIFCIMLKPRKRLTKKQIKEDKFVTYYFKAQEFISQNSRYIMWGLIGIPLVIFASFILSNIQQEKEQSAGIELSKARIDYFAGNYEGAISTLNNLNENYSGTEAGKKGLYYLANAHFFSKNFDEAEQYFREFSEGSGDRDLTVSALAGIAACQEERKDFSAAAETYKQAAEKYEAGFMAPQNLYDSARCFSLSGKTEEAAGILNKLIDKYSSSQIKNEAEILLAELNS